MPNNATDLLLMTHLLQMFCEKSHFWKSRENFSPLNGVRYRNLTFDQESVV